MSNSDTQQNANESDDEYTTDTQTRWAWTGTILASAMVLSLPVIIGLAALGVMSLSTITQGWFVLYLTVTLMAATWAFGKETLEAVKKARGG